MIHIKLSTIILFLILVHGGIPSSFVSAADIYVSPFGDDSLSGLDESNAVQTLTTAAALASNNANILLLSGTHVFTSTQSITRPLVIKPASTASGNVILTSNTLSSGSLISSTNSTGLITIANLTIDIRNSPIPPITLLSISGGISITLDSVKFVCKNQINSCIPFTVSGGQFRATNVTVEGGGTSSLTSVSSGSFVSASQFSFGWTSTCGVLRIVSAPSFSITSTSFSSGVAQQGAAICVQPTSTVLLEQLTCHNNTARSGGCIATFTSTLTIRNSTLNDNVAFGAANTDGGGAIYSEAGAVTVETSYFTRNQASFVGGTYRGRFFTALTVRNSSFVSNFAVTESGALALGGGAATIEYSSFFNNSLSVSNTASGFGTAIYASTSPNAVQVRYSLFEDNYAPFDQVQISSGALSTSGRPLTVTDCVFRNNAASLGAAIFITSPNNTRISGNVFSGNVACTGGGLAVQTASSLITIQSNIFKRNRAFVCRSSYASPVGGGVQMFDVKNAVFSHNLFEENLSEGTTSSIASGGAGLFLNPSLGGNIVVQHCIFNGNSAFINRTNALIGVACRIDGTQNSSVTLTNSTFFNNTQLEIFRGQSSYGGALGAIIPIGYESARLSLRILDSAFSSNTGIASGAVLLQNIDWVIQNTTFIENSGIYSGAITSLVFAFENVTYQGYVSNTTFSRNRGLSPNQALRPNNFADIQFSSNVSALGAIYNELTIESNTIFSNLAETEGNIVMDVRLLGGVKMTLVPLSGDLEGSNFRSPYLVMANGPTLDLSQVSTTLDRIWAWGARGVTTVPSKIIIGDFDAKITIGSHQMSEVSVTSVGRGKLILNGTVFALPTFSDKIFKNINVIIAEKGEYILYDSTLVLQNATVEVQNGGLFQQPLFNRVCNITGVGSRSAISVFGTFGFPNGILQTVRLALHNQGAAIFYVSNFWANSWIDCVDCSIHLDGPMRVDFRSALLNSPPTYLQAFAVFKNTNATFGSNFSVSGLAGMRATADLSVSQETRVLATSFYATQMRLSDDLARVVVSFPIATNAPNSPFCFGILSLETLSSLPINVECAWQTQSTLIIKTAQVPTRISVLPGAIVDIRDSRFFGDIPSDLLVLPPLNPFNPVITVNYARQTLNCANLTLDASATLYLGNLALSSFLWSIQDAASFPELSAFLQALPPSSSRITVPASMLQGVSSLNFTLGVTNSAGRSALAQIPVVRVNNPLQISIEGQEFRDAYVSSLNILRARVEVASCSNFNGNITREWAQLSGPSLRLAPPALDEFDLELPIRSLMANHTYVFQFSAWPASAPLQVARKSVSVRAIASTLSLVIDGPTGLVSNQQTLTLAAVLSDPDVSGIDPASYSWAWDALACAGKANAGIVSSVSLAQQYLEQGLAVITLDSTGEGQAVSLPESGTYCSNSSGDLFLLRQYLNLSTNSLFIPARTFPPGELLLSVTVVNRFDRRVASALVYLNFTSAASTVPISIRVPNLRQFRILPQEKLLLQAYINGSNLLTRSSQVLWRDIGNSSILRPSNLLTPRNSTNLVIRPETLTPEQFYALSVETFGAGGLNTGSSRIFVIANSAPSSGTIETDRDLVSYSRFLVKTSGWNDVDLPLRFIFSLAPSDGSGEIFLNELSDVPVASVLSPLSGSHRLIVRVFDLQGAMSLREIPVTIRSGSRSISDLEVEFAQFTLWGDVRSAVQIAIAISLAPNVDVQSSTTENILSGLARIVTRRPLSWINSPALINALSLVTVKSRLSETAIRHSITILESVVTSADAGVSVSSLSATSSNLARYSVSGFLSTAANTAKALLNTSSSDAVLKTRILNAVEKLVRLQALFLSVDELAAEIVSSTLNSSTVVVSEERLSETGGVVVVGSTQLVLSNWNQSIAISTTYWGAGAFPFAPSALTPVLQALLPPGSASRVSTTFELTGGTCALLQESSNTWDSSSCTTTARTDGKIDCTCAISAGNQGSSGRVSLALLFSIPPSSRDVSDPVGANIGGIVAGVVVGVFVLLVIGAIITIVFVPSIRAKVAPFWRGSSQLPSTTDDTELEEAANTRSSTWQEAQKPKV